MGPNSNEGQINGVGCMRWQNAKGLVTPQRLQVRVRLPVRLRTARSPYGNFERLTEYATGGVYCSCIDSGCLRRYRAVVDLWRSGFCH